MTNEEAIKELQSMCDHLHAHGICDKDSNMLTACKMAISALEQNESAEEWYKLFVEKLDEQEPCDDVVSRILTRMWNCRGKHTTNIDKVAMEQIIRDELPFVTQKYGKWIGYNYPAHECVYCSNCKTEYYEDDLYLGGSEFPKYCPNCGAKMQESEHKE